MKHIIRTLCATIFLMSQMLSFAQQAERFSISTLNVDGLPKKILVFNVKPNGPGSAGTVRIGKYLFQKNYDLMFFQEDFNYHDELTAFLEDNYQFDTWSGDIGVQDGVHKVDLLHAQNHQFECDGLGACWKKGIQVTAVTRTPWNDHFGKFSHAGDELIKKGFRRYEVTLAGGTRIIVYNLHMDASSVIDEKEGKDMKDRAARQGEYRQVREDIMNHLDNRPVIILGDLNSYHSREKIKENFIDIINATGLAEAHDVWIEVEKKGQYPTGQQEPIYSETEDRLLEGESRDKIIYINPVNGPKLKPLTYLLDTEGYQRNGKFMGDHIPVAATFEILGGAKTALQNLQAEQQDDSAVEFYNLKGQYVDQPDKGVYIERKGKDAHKRVIKK